MSFKSISKEQSSVMRALAILAIVAHNMLHCVGYIPENESTFVSEYPMQLWGNVTSASSGWFGDIFSFFGYYGVPVFIFLSGYGLVKKYESQGNAKLEVKPYLLSNYVKLLLLVLPATVFLIGLAFYEGSLKAAVYYVFGLTFLNDFVFNIFPPQPGVYWYFGLTLQLYLLYILFYRKRGNNILLLCFLGGLILLVFCNPSIWGTQGVLRYVRHNVIGWVSVFVLGIYWARNDGGSESRKVIVALKFLLSTILLAICCFEYHSWLLTPFFALLSTEYLSELIIRIPVLKSIFTWVGGISAAIFVVHPVIRMFLTSLVREHPWEGMMLYMIVVITIAFLYNLLYKWLRAYAYKRFAIK